MSSGQERSSGLPAEAQGTQRGTGAQGPGTTTGAAATGMATPTGTGTTTANYGRGTSPGAAPSAGYRPESSAEYAEAGDGMLGGTFMILAGLITFFAGLAAVVRTNYFHTVTGRYPYAWNVHSWGWAILILGVLLFAVGACAMLGMSWAKPVGVGIAVLTVIAAFMFLVYTPIWGIILLALSVLAIWGLLRQPA